jgi:hypothetical protein
MALDILASLNAALGPGPGVWTASTGWAYPFRRTVAPHLKFLAPGEAVLAVVQQAGAAGMVFTDRRFCWQADGAVHRLEYPDIRAEGVKVRGAAVVVPPTVRIRRRPDSQYTVATASPDAAAGLADLLRTLAAEPSPLDVSAIPSAWVPRPVRTPPVPRGAPEPPPPPPTRTADDVLALAAAGDPGAFEAATDAVVGYGRSDIGDLLIRLYRAGPGRPRAVLTAALSRMRFGKHVWRGVKAIYKLAEADRDAQMFGYLAARFDRDNDYSRRLTRHYLRRRAWRYLRRMGRQSPANYPYFAAEVLRHLTPEDFRPTGWDWGKLWTAWHILHRHTPGVRFTTHAVRSADGRLPGLTSSAGVAYPETWRADAGPLLHLVLHAEADPVRAWAVARLRADHAAKLRSLPAEAIIPFLSAKSEAAALFGWALLNVSLSPDEVSDEAMLAALAGPHAELSRRAADWLRKHRPPGRIPAPRWLAVAMGGHEGAAAFAVDRLKSHHLAELGRTEAFRLLTAPMPAARTLGLDLLRFRPDLAAADPASVADALDSPHADVRAGLIAMLDGLPLPAEAAFRLLEFPHSDVQTAARKLIETRFAGWNHPDGLLAAAECPDDAVAAWTVDMVIRHLAGDAARLAALTPFFRRVLYRVNAGGPAKRKLFGFLQLSAARHQQLAGLFLPLVGTFTRSRLRSEFESALTAAVCAGAPGLDVDDGVVRR